MKLGNPVGAICALVCAAIVSGASPSVAASAGDEPPAGLTRDDWSQIRQQVAAATYHASPVRRHGQGPAVEAANARQQYGTTFRRGGIELASAAVISPWRVGLSVTGYGYAGHLRRPEAADPQADKDRVEYRRGALTEWYVNRPAGLEQGFDLQEPQPRREGPLVVAMAVGGDIDVVARDGGAAFVDPSGETLVRYAGLKAWDADGRPLGARLDVVDREIRLSVDAETARFPVTVDPTFVNQAQLFGHGEQSELAGTGFGSAVAVEGDTAAIGAYQEAGAVGPAVGAAYVFVRTGGAWNLQQKLVALDGGVGDQFGTSIAISGETVVVGAPYEDNDVTSINDAGAAYVYVRSGGFWTEQQKLLASDAASGDQLAWRVAIFGDTVVAGAPFDDVAAQTDIGSAYVFVRSGTVWTEQQKLAPSGGAVSDSFGSGVSVFGDTAVVGARLGDGAAVDSGSAYVFVRSGTVWTEQQELTALDGAPGDAFGAAVSVFVDTVVVGAPDDGGSQGSAYVFVRSGTTWTEQQKLLASDGIASDSMGTSVSISGDTFVAGAPNDNTFVGAAYVFVRSGTTWSEQQKLVSGGAGILFFGISVSVSGDTALVGEHAGGTGVGSAYGFVRSGTTWSLQGFLQPPWVTAGDWFGRSVAVSGDTVVVGASHDDRPGGVDLGSAYVFVWTGVYWAEQALLQPSDGAAGDNFGHAVSIDGDTVVVGAVWDDTAAGANAGSAYVFVRSGTTWTEQQKLTASDAAVDDAFGSSVSISGDTVVVGALNDDVAGQDTGSGYVFVRSGTTWTEQQKLTAPDAAPFDWFGSSAAIAGDTAVLGAPTADTVGGDAGAAYVFVRSGTTWSLQQKLGASDAAAGDGFGNGVSLSGDTAVIGAPFLFSIGPPGGAYVFVRSGTTWTEQQKLTGSDAVASDQFGWAVSISGDTVVVSALLGDTPGGPNAGSAYVFVRAGTTWTEQPLKIVAPDGTSGDAFGYAVGLAGDVAVVGALLDDTVGGADSGSAYVYRRISLADLAVTKTDGQTTASPGELITYTIIVSNAGPEAVTGATVSDAVPAALLGATWTCSASAGSSCTPSGAGNINDTVDLLVGGTATYLLTGTVDAAATGTLSNTVTVTPGTGDFDPDTGNNSATDSDILAPEADLSVTKTDSPDPVLPGGTLTYTVTVTNLGPSAATSVTLVDTLPAGVAFVSSTPGPPTCNIAGPTLTCDLGTLAGGGGITVTIVTTVNGGAAGILLNTASVSAAEPDPSSGNNSATANTAVGAKDGELAHGSVFAFDLAAQAGPVADEDVFRISQKPYSSYEVVVDATSGDIGAGNGPLLERIGPDGSTVLQTSAPVGVGPSRSLRWTNTTASTVDGETVRVRSATCGTDCGADDVYRLRSYETTYTVPRFNNAGTQVTVLILQNPTNDPITGEVYFRVPSGALVATHPVSLAPKETIVVNTASIPGAGGVSGAMTVVHDGRYGELSGKTVALEPATGFSFDSALEPRP